MPNIEIYGYSFIGAAFRQFKEMEEASSLREKIQDALKQAGWEKEVVVTSIDSTCLSCDEPPKKMPFLRVCSTDTAEIKRLIDTLKNAQIGVDVETLLLNSFVPADEMK